MLGSLLIALASISFAATPATQPAADEQGVRQAMDAYVDAFNHADADALGAFFADDAQYVNEDGTVVKGRREIREFLASDLKEHKDEKLRVQIESVELTRHKMAVVHGTGTISSKEGDPSETHFRVVYILRNDKWVIKTAEELGEWGDTLEQLDWLIGSWLDEDENASISTECSWTTNHRFISRSFVASYKNGPELRGTEIIGWDPASRAIRSWIFDSDGSTGQSVWTYRGKEWVIKSRGVLPDGSRASAVHIITRVDPDKYTWESVDREVDGQILPDIPPITIARVTTQPANAAAEKNP